MNSPAITPPVPSTLRLRPILLLTLAGLALMGVGFLFGWEAAINVEPMHVSVECEPQLPI